MRKCLGYLTLTSLFIAIAWWVISPGVFTVQPLGAIPEGATIVYHSRGPNMPLFASADGLCLQIQGSVSLFCRASALGGVKPITERIMLRLPYIHYAYLASTGGQEFDR